MYCLVQIQNLQFDSFVFTCTQPVNSKFTIWHSSKCNDDGGFRSFLIYSYVCLSIQVSVCPFVDLSIRLPACLNPNCGQTVPCRIKINSNKGRSLDEELSDKGNVGRDDTCFPVVKYNYLCADFCSRQFMESWSLLLSWNLRPTFYLIDFYSIYFEIWFNRSDEQKFWIVFQYNFYILWENGIFFLIGN